MSGLLGGGGGGGGGGRPPEPVYAPPPKAIPRGIGGGGADEAGSNLNAAAGQRNQVRRASTALDEYGNTKTG